MGIESILQMMKKVAETLLLLFLRRYPLPTRISLFSYFGQYSWLKDVIEELRPVLFPEKSEPLDVLQPVPDRSQTDPEILGILDRLEIRGSTGYYQAKTYLGARGKGHLFGAIETKSQRPVVIKAFRLPPTLFNKADAFQRQNNFRQLAGMQLADGRMQEFRVIQPLEAIADSGSHERCFLVTNDRDRSSTLRQYLQKNLAISTFQVREVLSQILQSLDFLHKQKFTLPSGVIQEGLIHGNLSLDSLLWTEIQFQGRSQVFIYLSDFWLWEQWFDTGAVLERSMQATPKNIQRDLKAVGQIGRELLQTFDPPESPLERRTLRIDSGSDSGLSSPSSPFSMGLGGSRLGSIIEALQSGKYNSAEAARRDLLQLANRSPVKLTPLDESGIQSTPPLSWFSPLLLLSLMGLFAGALVLLPRLRSNEAYKPPAVVISNCCLKEVSAIPAESYRYTSVQEGTWWNVLQQPNLVQRGQSLTAAIAIAQPKLQLQYVPATSLEQVYAAVESGEVSFAVLPVITELPATLLGQEIAYDGLATVVSFSYSQREQGLPTALQGQMSLNQVQQLYLGQVEQLQKQGNASNALPFGQRYMSKNPEAIAIFEQQVLQSHKLPNIQSLTVLPSIELLRNVIRDFEDRQIGSVGVLPLSEMWGQCSIYPLALSNIGQKAVQPMVLSNGQEIDPTTDLCTRKGAYGPDSQRFQLSQYPLSYPIMVVYPRDNRRSAIGKKFVELLRTVEGQRLLKAAGLVPLTQIRALPASTTSGAPYVK